MSNFRISPSPRLLYSWPMACWRPWDCKRRCLRARRCRSGQRRSRASCWARYSPLPLCILPPRKPGSDGPPQDRSSFPIGVEFQNTAGAALQQSVMVPYWRPWPIPLTGSPLLILSTGNRPFESSFIIREALRAPMVDPNVVMLVDVEAAYLTNHPVVREPLRPGGIDDRPRRFAGAGRVVHTPILWPSRSSAPVLVKRLIASLSAAIARLARGPIPFAANAAVVLR